jgi:FtsH-binding integral membrane protein
MDPRARDGFVDDWAQGGSVAQARTDFLHRTYQHLAGAIIAFIVIEGMLLSIPGIGQVVGLMSGRLSWLVVLGAFMAVSWIAERWAQSDASPGMQYVGLGLYVFAEAVIFVPLLYVASRVAGPDVIPTAAVITGFTFGGLTALVLMSKRDFGFLGGILRVAGFGAMGLILASALFGFNLGTIFACAMALFACGAIVYETSNLQHRFRTDQHVAASLALFASVALLFWYVLRIVLDSRR